MEYELSKIDKGELKKLNLVDNNGNLLLDKENREFLRNGKLTDDVELKGIKIKDKEVDIKASLSLYKENGVVKLRVHPYYKDLEKNQLLSDEERQYFSQHKGVHSKFTAISGEIEEHGAAKYKFDEKQQDNYYVKLKTDSGKSETVWGVNLQKEMQNKEIGEKVTIKYTGKERVKVNIPQTLPDGRITFKSIETDRNNFSVTPYNEKNDYRNNRVLIEFNKEKNSFQIVNSKEVPKVKAINGENITKEQQEALERGEEITTKDGNVSYSPQKQSLISDSRKLMLASILFDGGLSYAIIKTTDYLINKQQQKDLLRNQEQEKELQQEKSRQQAEPKEKQEKTGQEQTKEKEIKAGVDKDYIRQLETLSKEIDNKMRQSENKKELSDIKDYIGKEIDRVSATPYQESDLEQRPEHEQKIEDAEQKNELPFDEHMEIDNKEEIKHNDSLDDWERNQIERQEMEFNEREMEEKEEEEVQERDLENDGREPEEEEEEEEKQEQSRGRGR